MKKPFFIPLKAEYFEAFERGEKTHEYRKAGSKFEAIEPGREVTLSYGYSGRRIDCVCTAVETLNINDFDDETRAVIESIYPGAERILKIHLGRFGESHVKENL